MIKHGLEDINLINPLEGKLDKIIECFVKFYGEGARKRITQRLEHTKFYFEPKKSRHGIEAINKRFDALEKSLDKSSVTYEEDKAYLEREKARFENLEFENAIEDCDKECSINSNSLMIRHILKYLKPKEIKKFVLDIQEILPIYEDYIFKRKEFMTKDDINLYSFMISLIGNAAKVNGMSDDKLVKQGVESLLDEEKTRELKKGLEELLEERNNKILANPEVAQFAKDIKKTSLYRKKEIISEVFDFMLEPTSQGFDILSVDLNDPKTTLNFCFCSSGLELDDLVLIHEINHAISSRCEICDDNFIYKVGFSYQIEKFENSKIKGITVVNDCRILNEVINDYLAIKVGNIAIEEGVRLGVRERGGSDYALLFPLFEDFFEAYLEDLKKCYISDDPLSFGKMIGKENFQKLSILADKYYEMLLNLSDNEKIIPYMKRVSEGQRMGKEFFEIARHDKNLSEEEQDFFEIFRQAKKVYDDIDAICGERKNKVEAKVEDYGFKEVDL